MRGFGISLSGVSFETLRRRNRATSCLIPFEGELSVESCRICLLLAEAARGEFTWPDTFELSADPGAYGSSSVPSPLLFLKRILNFRPATLDLRDISGEVEGEERVLRLTGSIIGMFSRLALEDTSCGPLILRFFVDRRCESVLRCGLLATLHSASSGDMGGLTCGLFKAAVASEAC